MHGFDSHFLCRITKFASLRGATIAFELSHLTKERVVCKENGNLLYRIQGITNELIKF